MKVIKYTFFILVVLSLSYCKKDEGVEEAVDMGYNYFPDDTGRWVMYEVDSTWQDDKLFIDTLYKYMLLEKVVSIFPDNSGRPTMRIERYIKNYDPQVPYDSMNWIGPKIWYANKTSSTAEKVEENVRYIKLIFPPKEGKEWNGNTYNSKAWKDYEITSVDEAETINGNAFDSVVTILQEKHSDFIQYMYEEEKFARNVGLVNKIRDSLYDGGTADTVGYTFHQKVVSYGK